MRKTLCVFLVLVLCLFATGYAEEEATIDVQKLFGKTENGVYENEILGLGFNMDGWETVPDEELERSYKTANAILPSQLTQYMDESRNITVMNVRQDLDNVNIKLRYLGSIAKEVTDTDMEIIVQPALEGILKVFKAGGFENTEGRNVKTEIEDREYSGYIFGYEIMGLRLYSRCAMLIRDEYLVTITATSAFEDKTEEIFQHFYHLKDSEE